MIRRVLISAVVLAATATTLAQTSAPKVLPIRIILLTRSQVIEESPSGLLTLRRSTIEPFQVEEMRALFKTFASQIATLQAAAQSAIQGIEPKLEITEDPEPVMVWDKAGMKSPATTPNITLRSPLDPLGELFLRPAASRVNSDFFQTNEGIYLGPYAFTFIIHAGLIDENREFKIDGRPAASIGYYSFSRLSAQQGLASRMVELYQRGVQGTNSQKPPAPALFSGDGSAAPLEEGGVQFLRITSTGLVQRAEVTLPLTPNSEQLRFKFRSSSKDLVAVTAYDGAGKALGSTALIGAVRRPLGDQTPLFSSPVTVDGKWQDVKIDLGQLSGGKPIARLTIGSGPYIGLSERRFSEQTIYDVAEPASGPKSGDSLTLAPLAQDKDLGEVETLMGQGLTDSQFKTIAELHESGNDEQRLAILGMFLKTPDLRAFPLLKTSSTSAGAAEAWVACRALAKLNTPEAWAHLETVAQRGPFDSNLRAAAQQFIGRKDPKSIPKLSILMIQRGWQTRLAGAEAIGSILERNANVVLMTSFAPQAEPVAMVRLRIAELLDPTFELAARRLLYAAVNDPSQWVRAISASRIIDSPFPQIREEALRVVKDDSAMVRRWLLDRMAEGGKDYYRSSLRSAVIDPVAEVRAAAIRAFASQPGDVSSAEISSAFADDSEEVQLALAVLASKKRSAVPNEVVQKLKTSVHESVRKAAAGL